LKGNFQFKGNLRGYLARFTHDTTVVTLKKVGKAGKVKKGQLIFEGPPSPGKGPYSCFKCVVGGVG